MIFYEYLRASEPATIEFFERVKRSELLAYTAVLIFDELAYRVLLAHIRDNHPGSSLDHLRHNESQMIADYYPDISQALSQLQIFPNLAVADTISADLSNMHTHILQYQLRPRDALHLAVMFRIGCIHLVSNDSDFDRVQSIHRYTIP